MYKAMGLTKAIFFTALMLLGILSYGGKPAFASGHVESTYYKSGELECKTPYRDGRIEGTRTCFYKSGIKKSEAVFENNTERIFTWFAPDGVPLMSMEYDSGHNLVQTKTWYTSGEVKNVTAYKNGMRHGLFLEYHRDGAIKSEIFYENDMPRERLHK